MSPERSWVNRSDSVRDMGRNRLSSLKLGCDAKRFGKYCTIQFTPPSPSNCKDSKVFLNYRNGCNHVKLHKHILCVHAELSAYNCKHEQRKNECMGGICANFSVSHWPQVTGSLTTPLCSGAAFLKVCPPPLHIPPIWSSTRSDQWWHPSDQWWQPSYSWVGKQDTMRPIPVRGLGCFVALPTEPSFQPLFVVSRS